MATDKSKYRRHHRERISEDFGAIAIAFGPHYTDNVPVVRLLVADAGQFTAVGPVTKYGGPTQTLAIALGLEDARKLRNHLNAIIGLIVEDAKP